MGERVEVDGLWTLCGGDVEDDALHAEGASDRAEGGVTSGSGARGGRTEDLLGADGDESDSQAEDEDDEAEGDLFPPGLDHVLVGETADRGEEKGGRPEGDETGEDAPWVEASADAGARYPARRGGCEGGRGVDEGDGCNTALRAREGFCTTDGGAGSWGAWLVGEAGHV